MSAVILKTAISNSNYLEHKETVPRRKISLSNSRSEHSNNLKQFSQHATLIPSPNGKTKQDLDLKTDKELFEKYEWKEDYSYFGVKFKAPLKIPNSIVLTMLHLAAGYAIYTIYGEPLEFCRYFLWFTCLGSLGGFGVTAGVHRYWTHRCYKANLPMRILLAMCYSVAGQNPIPEWVRNHRVHHKYSETDADPHNSKRGFFFAHVGWLMMKKHPAVREKGKTVDMSDVLEDPVVQFHTKYFILIELFFCFIIPTAVPVYLWNADWFHSFLYSGVLRYVLSLNFTWNVNSVAHLWGNKPYDRRMGPSENRLVSLLAYGEGWHNYHHVFPWDYKASELPYQMNVTTYMLDVFAKIGWVYDRKTASPSLIKSTSLKHGDGTHPEWGHQEIPDPFDQNNIKDKQL